MIEIPLIIFSVFGGIASIIAAIGGCIMLSQGKFTLPGTNMRKLADSKTSVEVIKSQFEYDSISANIETRQLQRLEENVNRMLEPGDKPQPSVFATQPPPPPPTSSFHGGSAQHYLGDIEQ